MRNGDEQMTGEFAKRLLVASKSRSFFDVEGEPHAVVEAELLREAIRDLSSEVDPFGLRFSGGEIRGSLDLGAMHIPFPLYFDGCTFSDPVIIEGCEVKELRLLGCAIPGLQANGCRLSGDLDLSGSVISGALTSTASASMTSAIWLTEAQIAGRMLLVGTVIETSADRAIHADRSKFGGNLRFIHGFRSNAELRLLAVQVAGSIDFAGAELSPTSFRALDLGESVIDGSLFILADRSGRRTVIRGRIEMGHVRIGGRVSIRSSSLIAPPPGLGGHHYLSLDSPGRIAFWAPRLSVVGDFTLDGDCQLVGGLDLSMSEIGGSLLADGQVLENSGGIAVNLTTAQIRGDVSISTKPGAAALVNGTALLRGLTVGGSLRFRGTSLGHPAEADHLTGKTGHLPLISAEGSKIARDVNLRRAEAIDGSLWFGQATINGDLDLKGAILHSPGSHSASFHQAKILGSVKLGRETDLDAVPKDFSSTGLLAFNHAAIGGRLIFDGCTLSWGSDERPAFNRHGAAFEAIEASVDGGAMLGWNTVDGAVDFSGASTSYLADDPANWGDHVRVTGFTYGRFAPLGGDSAHPDGHWDVKARAAWLGKQPTLDSAPFEYAASVYRTRGLHVDAEQLLIAGQRMRRRASRHKGIVRVRATGDWLYLKLFGYGYRPRRAVLALFSLLLLTFLPASFAAHQRTMRATDGNGTIFTSAGPVARSPGVDPAHADGLSGIVGRCGDGLVVCFQPLLYAVDTVIPVIDLGQRAQWHPDVDQQYGTLYEYWFSLMSGLGWAFSAVAALTFGRLGRSRAA